MARVIASGDHHFCESSPRWAECLRVHDWMVELVERERPDVFLSAGDILDRRSTPLERETIARWLCRIAAVCPVVIARGNHDESLDLFGALETAHPIAVEQRAMVHYVEDIAIAAVAWPSKASLAAAGAGDDESARAALRAVFLGLQQELERHDGPKVLLGHFMIDGSVMSAGNPLIGAEMNVGLADLALVGADVTIAGHIHRPQLWEYDGRPILYTGSPFRTAYGEVEEKSVALVEIDGGRVTVTRVPTPCASMLLVTGNYLVDELGPDLERWTGLATDAPRSIEAGSEIRLRYLVDADRRDAARVAAHGLRDRWLTEGAAFVKVEEEVIATGTARAPEIASAPDVAGKLRALWKARADEPDGPRADRLVSLATSLEAA